MKKIIIAAVLSLSTSFAGELPARYLEMLGRYESQAAMNSDYADYMAAFKVQLTPDNELILEFEDSGHELEIDKDMQFYDSQLSECEDPGCSGIADVSGEITFKTIDGKVTPVATVTYNFYADISEELDCDEIDCDNLDHDDYWKEWEETYEYVFKGSYAGQLPAFNPRPMSAELQKLAEDCKPLAKISWVKCSQIQDIQFNETISEANLKTLQDYLRASFKEKLSKEQIVLVLKTQMDNLLLQMKMFQFGHIETETYKAVEAYYAAVLARIEQSQASEFRVSLFRGSNYYKEEFIDILMIDRESRSVEFIHFNF